MNKSYSQVPIKFVLKQYFALFSAKIVSKLALEWFKFDSKFSPVCSISYLASYNKYQIFCKVPWDVMKEKPLVELMHAPPSVNLYSQQNHNYNNSNNNNNNHNNNLNNNNQHAKI